VGRIEHIFFALIILSAFFWVVESLFAANPEQPKWRPDIRTDIVYWFITSLMTKTIANVGLGAGFYLVYRQNPHEVLAVLNNRSTLLGQQPLRLQAIEMVVVGDLIGYWTHRWFHGRRMWKFHAIHHCSPHLDWLSSVRLHPVNDWLSRWIQVSVLIILGFTPKAVAAYVPFLTFYAIMVHANVSWGFGPLGRVIASPKFHRWHHTSEDEGLDKNFAGLIPAIDMVFGTYYMPEGKLPQKFGLKNQKVPDGFLAQMVYPFTSRKKHVRS